MKKLLSNRPLGKPKDSREARLVSQALKASSSLFISGALRLVKLSPRSLVSIDVRSDNLLSVPRAKSFCRLEKTTSTQLLFMIGPLRANSATPVWI